MPRRHVNQPLMKESRSYFVIGQLCILLGSELPNTFKLSFDLHKLQASYAVPLCVYMMNFSLSTTGTRGRIVDSSSLPEFDCEFWAKPASNITRKALRLSKAIPTLLEVELLPTGHILNDVYHRSPRLSDVELFLFPDEKETERYSQKPFSTTDKASHSYPIRLCFRSKREHAHLFEAMSTRNAMIKVNINGTELLIFSSKLLDKTSQCMPTCMYIYTLSIISQWLQE